ncbi:MAG: DUF2147 domain-containing protein, partial [Bacteroidales bacterium]
MKRTTIGLLLYFSCFVAFANPIEGQWRAIDEKGLVSSIIRIFRVNNVYHGSVEELITKPNDTRCKKCLGNLKNELVQGMQILTKLRYDGKEYVDGEILDPETGKIYYCKAKLMDGERKLHLRASLDAKGFLGQT